ncbi:MAG: SsrA-binding protein SmpB [Chloroflexi bacterium]|jgi:SsrA-binding protein|nr:SsrA-binding protein SmpB [Chloroflexota bacterium]
MAKKKDQEPVRGGNRLIASNRKAYHDYFIDETLEAGLVLVGSEIKSIRAGRVNLRDSYVTIRNGEAWLIGTHIAGYAEASYQDHDPNRDRKLLLHRREIDRWLGKAEQKGYTIVPLKLYLKDNRAKVEIGLARGKRQYDKRETIAKRDSERDMRRAIKQEYQ